MNKKLFTVLKLLLPFIAIAISVLIYYNIENNGKQKKMDHPYYLYLLAVIGGVILLEILIGLFNEKIRKRIIPGNPIPTPTCSSPLCAWLIALPSPVAFFSRLDT